jgi:hypothetical protein
LIARKACGLPDWLSFHPEDGKMCSSETSVIIYPNTQFDIPEDSTVLSVHSSREISSHGAVNNSISSEEILLSDAIFVAALDFVIRTSLIMIVNFMA